MIGQTLLHYRITGRLGAGGMGEVFVAEDQKLRRSVAIKVLPAALALDPENRQRFEHEARVVGALNHPNIVTIYSVESVDEQLFITMELVRGTVLADRIPHDGMRVTEFLDVAIPMADAVAAAHGSGVVHRDLKPHNVMVTDDGRVKVLDFGLAQVHALSEEMSSDVTRPPLTAEGHVIGTFAYMAPEQAEGRRVDARSDIFSLGAVFYQMLSGAAPFKGGTAVSTLAAVIKDDPRRLADLRADLPRDLSRLVTRCLAKDPNRRYQDAADLRTDLEDVKLDLSAGFVDASVAAQRRKPLVGKWIAISVVLAMVAASGFLGYRAREPARTIGPNLDGSFVRLTSRSGEELFPTVSPDGEFVAYAGRAAGNWDIFLQRIDGERPINLTDDSASADTEPAFSPDGRTIAFRSERDGGGIFVMGATGENVKRVSTIGHNPSWSPSGDEILINEDAITDPMARGTTGQLWAVAVASGKRRPLPTTVDAVQASWSPNGHRIAFWGVHRGGQRDIWTVAPSGADPKAVTADEALDWNPVWAPDGRHLYFASERGGTMNLWRVPIDERSGDVRGALEPVTTPSAYSQHLSFARNGQRLAYVEVARRVHLQRLSFDPDREVVDAPSWILQDAKPARNPNLSADGKTLVFDAVEGAQEDLFVVRADGTGLRRLTDDGFKDRGPRWSPDGKQILFLSDRSGQYDVWRMNPDGSGVERVSFMKGERWAQVALSSPDGNRVLVNRNAGAPLIIDARVPWATQSPVVTAPDNDDNLDFFAWSWSPDGHVLAGHAHSFVGVLTYSLKSRQFQQLTNFGGRPAWLADSRRLLFTDSQKIYVLDSLTKRVKEVYSAAPHRLQGITVSVDNRSINIAVSINEADIWLASLK